MTPWPEIPTTEKTTKMPERERDDNTNNGDITPQDKFYKIHDIPSGHSLY